MRKPRGRFVACLLLIGSGSTLFGTCNSPIAEEFRAAAGSGLQDGLKTITDSLIDGLFAVFTPSSTNGA